MAEKKIIIEKRPDDYMAYLDGRKGIWGCGTTYDEAIGDMIRAHKDEFNLEIIYPKMRV